MKIRRCAVLYIEPREELAIDWSALFAGGGTLAASTRWLALAPHLDSEIEVDAADLVAMADLSQSVWTEHDERTRRHDAACLDRLLAVGLLIGDDDAPAHAAHRARDETLRAQHWRPLAALAHTFSRWHDVRTETGMEAPSFQQLLERFGTPPAPTMDSGATEGAVRLPAPAAGLLDETLLQRYTGRNYDLSQPFFCQSALRSSSRPRCA